MNKRLIKWFFPFVLILFSGCAKTVAWHEEVQLSDGRVIVVEREIVRVSGGLELAHGGSGTSPKENRIYFEFPLGSGKTVEWRSTKSNPQEWPEIPLIFDFKDGKPIVVTINSGGGCEYYSQYEFHDGRWGESQMLDQIEPRQSNLYLKSGPSMPSYVDWATKVKENADIRYPERLRLVGPKRIFCGR